MYGHMEWADAKIWRAIKKLPAEEVEAQMKERLFHIHFTQHAFRQVWEGETFKRMKSDQFESVDAIYDWAQTYYPKINAFIETLEDEAMKQPMNMPWAGYFGRGMGIEVADTTLGETMLQVACHSIHHRAQLNMQIRSLDQEPPLIDYIVWLWSGQPAAEWG